MLHCPTFRGPLRRPACPLVVTVHDLAVLRHPEAFNAWTRRVQPALPCHGRPRGAARDRGLRVHEARAGRAARRPGGAGARDARTASTRCSRPTGPRPSGDYVLAVGTLEPRKNLPRCAEAARASAVELRVAGAPGWGDVAARRRALGSARSRRRARAPLPRRALRRLPVALRGLRDPVLEAMACGAPVVTSRGGATEEIAGGAAVLVDPLDPDAIAAGIDEAIGVARSCGRLGLERARAFTWDEAAALDCRGLPRRSAREPLVVIDADVLGRQRTGDETYVENLLRALAGRSRARRSRLAAITRRPDLVPGGSSRSSCRRAARSCAWPGRVPRAAAAAPAGARALPARAPARAARARPSSRSRTSRSSATRR